MTTIGNATPCASFSQRFGRVFVVLLILGSLATTGCDMVDSNAREDARPSDTALAASEAYHKRTIGPSRWITPSTESEVLVHAYQAEPSLDWPVSFLIGAWVLTSADVYTPAQSSNRPEITFREDGIFTGYGDCYNFSGRYRADSDWHLTMYDLRVSQKFCVRDDDPVREMLLEGLQTVTGFRFEHGTLWTTSRGGKRERIFIFERMDADAGASAIGMPPAEAS